MSIYNALRYIGIVTLCATVMISCDKKATSKYEISGKLENLTGNYFLMSHEVGDSVVIDTIPINAKGEFSFKGAVDTLTEMSLYFNQNTKSTYILVNKGWDVELKGDALYPDLINVKGGDVNNDLTTFKNQNKDLLKNRADILIAAEKQRYAEQAATQGGWNGWREFKVVRKQPESSVITSFYLQPVDGGALPEYAAGQYVSVRVNVPELGIKQPRQYSLSQAATGAELRISVKRESASEAFAAGYVSNTLHEHVHIGDVIEVSHPNGDFVLQNADKANVFISAGVGITPMMAMLGQVAAKNMPQATSFIHACRDEHSLSMKSAVRAIKQRFPQLQTYLACETAPVSDLAVQAVGRLDLHVLDRALLPADADYYVCGPVGFMQSQYHSLLGLGIAPEQIHMEAFNTGGIAAAMA